MRRSSDSCLANFRSRSCLPGNIPVTGFRHRIRHSTYSGGTVRDSHPVILFSIPGSSPEMPRSGLSNCQNHCSMGNTPCQSCFLPQSGVEGCRAVRFPSAVRNALSAGTCRLKCSRTVPVRRSRRCSSDSTGIDWCRDRSPWRIPGNCPPAGGTPRRRARSGPGR